MSKQKRRDATLLDQDIRELLPDALRLLGLGMPITLEDVARAEAKLEEMDVHLPESLRDAEFDRTSKSGSRVLTRPQTQEVVEELRQAARFGGQIPEEVRSKMSEDRARSEREAEKQEVND